MTDNTCPEFRIEPAFLFKSTATKIGEVGFWPARRDEQGRSLLAALAACKKHKA